MVLNIVLNIVLNLVLNSISYEECGNLKVVNHGGNLLEIIGNKAKGRISKRVFQENKARQLFRKNKRTCAYQGVRNVRFSENLSCFVFLKHPF